MVLRIRESGRAINAVRHSLARRDCAASNRISGGVTPDACASFQAGAHRRGFGMLAARPRQKSRRRRLGRLLALGSGSAGYVRELSFSDTSHQGILYWNAIYTLLALDALPGRSADDELAGLMPTIFERVA
jgi:hypothetical protein